jgi:hypothetical protein
VYLLSVWALHARRRAPGFLRHGTTPLGVAIILASTFTSEPVLITGITSALIVAASVLGREGRPSAPVAH